MKTLPPSVARRRALKSAILRAARIDTVPDLAQLQATSRSWTKDDYSRLAERFGLNVDAINRDTDAGQFSADDTSDDASDTDASDTTEAGDTAPVDDAQSRAADADVARLDDLWRNFDIPAHRALVRDLAMRANRPDPEPITLAPVIPGAVPHAKRIGTRTAHEMFNVSIDNPLSRLNLPVYDARDCALDTSYVMPACVPAILLMAIEHRTGIFLTGPAGTGKTTLAQQIAARLGRPYVRISCTANTDAATLVGMTVPNKDGGVIFQPGILTRAVTRPGVVLLIDEPSTARDGILYVLQSLLDDARRITVDETGDVFPLAQDAIVILADNTNGSGDSTGAYAGTRTLSRALLDRVEMFHVDYLPPDKEQTVLISHTGATHNLAAMVIEFARVTRAKVAEGEIPTAIGMRRLVSLTRQLMAGIPLPDAAATAFLNSAAPDVREVYQQLMTTHLPADAIARSLKA